MCLRFYTRIVWIACWIIVASLTGAGDGWAQDNQRLKKGFQRLDRNNDGQLSEKEIGVFPPLKDRLQGADSDGDGGISLDEFRTHLSRGGQRLSPTTGKLGTGDSLRIVKVGEVERRYRVHVPKGYNSSKPTPVVIAFHGGGGNPESMIRLSGLNDKSEQAGFIVAYPYGSGRQADRGLTFHGGNCCGYAQRKRIDDVGFIRVLLDDLAEAANVDPRRVFATGLSNGGIMAHYLGCQLADRVAAIAPVAGPLMTDTCNPSRPVPVMHFHGTADELAPFHGGKGQGTASVPAFLRPSFTSVADTIERWVKANGCTAEPSEEALPDNAEDGMRVVRKTWGNGREGSEVVLIEIANGGHTWPGRKPISPILGKATMDISANDLMWEFFQKHPMPPKSGR